MVNVQFGFPTEGWVNWTPKIPNGVPPITHEGSDNRQGTPAGVVGPGKLSVPAATEAAPVNRSNRSLVLGRIKVRTDYTNQQEKELGGKH